MRKSFEHIIGSYNDAAREQREGGLKPYEEAELEGEISSLIRRASKKRGHDTRGAQDAIFHLQQRKQRVMGLLKERIAQLDDPSFAPEKRRGERLVTASESGYVVHGDNGKRYQATKGELITDMDWGVYYHLDPATVDRNTRKRYLIEDAKQELGRLLDEQITEDELTSRFTDDFKKSAYRGRAESSGESTGFLAERMVKGLLRQMTYDTDVEFQVLEADAYDDVEHKMDFVVKRRRHERGVEVAEDAKAERVGVQFTTNMSDEARQTKERQLERARQALRKYHELNVQNEAPRADEDVRDLVLVQIPAAQVRSAYEQWQEEKPPGGPEKLWEAEVKQDVFRGVMENVLDHEEIEAGAATLATAGAGIEEKELSTA